MSNILIIQLSRIGDILRTLPLMNALKKKEPASTVSLLCVEEFSSLLELFLVPDKILTLPAEMVYRLQQMNQPDPSFIEACIKKMTGEAAYHQIINLNHELGAAMLADQLQGYKKKGRLYHSRVPIFIPDSWGKYLFAFTQNRVQNFYNMAEIYLKMGDSKFKGNENQTKLVFDGDQAEKTSRLLKENGYQGGRLVFLQLGSSHGLRSWPLENFARLANLLSANLPCQIAIIGSSGERSLADRFLQLAGFPLIDLVGKTPLKLLPAVLAAGNLMITNDTGPLHIANLVEIPIICILLSTGYISESAPYGAGHICIYPNLSCYPCTPDKTCDPMICKETITVETVETIASDILAETIPETWDCGNASALKTGFSRDGSLQLIPMNRRVSSHFLTGYIHKIVFRAMFSDESEHLLFDELPAIDGLPEQLMASLNQAAAELEEAQEEIQNGLTLLPKISRLLSAPGHNTQTVTTLFEQIKVIENRFFSKQDSLLHLFHILDMMDIGDADTLTMINLMLGKYRVRKSQLIRAITALESFADHLTRS